MDNELLLCKKECNNEYGFTNYNINLNVKNNRLCLNTSIVEYDNYNNKTKRYDGDFTVNHSYGFFNTTLNKKDIIELIKFLKNIENMVE